MNRKPLYSKLNCCNNYTYAIMENSSHVELANLTFCGDNCSVTGNTTFPQFRCGIPSFLPPCNCSCSHWWHAGYYCTHCRHLGILLNGTVLHLIAHFKHLHQRSFFLALQLNISHIITASTVIVSIVVSAIARGWLFEEVFCQIVGMVNDRWTCFCEISYDAGFHSW